MNGFERISCVLDGKKPDRTPVMLHNFMMAAKEAGYTMHQYREDPQAIANSFIKSVEKYHYDGIFVDLDTVTLAGACGVRIDFPIDYPARSHDGILNSLSDVSSLRKINISDYRYVRNWCEGVKLLKEHFNNDVLIRGNCDQAPFSLATMLRGTENFMMDLCLEPKEKILELLEYCTDITCQMISLMKEAGADMVSNGDSPAGPSMLSPEMYIDFAFPYEKRVVNYAHKLNLPYALHICGNTDLIIDKMIETNADLLELDYKTNIRNAESLMRDKTVFVGNIDPSGIIALGTAQQVKEKVKELLNIFEENPRFILNAGCAIPADTPEENIFAMMKMVEE